MARGGLGGCFPGFPSSPTQQQAAGRDRGPGPERLGPAGRSRKGCVAREGRRWGVGRRWLSQLFFPCPFLPLPPRSWERSGEGRGRGSRGQRGEQPDPAGRCPLHTEGARGSLAAAIRRLGGFGPQFPLPHSHGQRGLTPAIAAAYWAFLKLLALSGVLFTSILTSNRIIIIISY